MYHVCDECCWWLGGCLVPRVFHCRLKPFILKVFPSIVIYTLLRLIWNLTTRCLAVTGSGSVGECGRLTLSPLSSHSMGSPECPDTTLFLTVFFWKFRSRYFRFTRINQRPAGRYFGFTGICNG